jgi:hypothetical protein
MIEADAVSTPFACLWYVAKNHHSLTCTHGMQASAIVYNTLAVLETRFGLGLPLAIVPEINEERYILVGRSIHSLYPSDQSLTPVARICRETDIHLG